MVKRRVCAAAAVALACLPPAVLAKPYPLARQLAETAAISGTTISPDGHYVAYRVERPSVATNGIKLQWRAVPLTGGGALVLSDGGKPLWTQAGTVEPAEAEWSPNSRYLYFKALKDGEVQVWRTSPAGGSRASQVTDFAADVQRFAVLDGTELLVQVAGATREEIVAAEKREYDSGIRIDSSIDAAQGLYRAVEIAGRLASERLVGEWFSRSHLLGDRPPVFHRVSLAGGGIAEVAHDTAKRLLSPEIPGDPEAHSIAPGEGSAGIAFVSGWGKSARPAWISGAGAEPLVCSDEACVGATSAAIRYGSQIVFTRADAFGTESLGIWDRQTGKVRTVARTNGRLSGELGDGCSVSRRYAACAYEAAGRPPVLVAIDLETGRTRTLDDPNANLAERLPVEPRTVRFRLSDGREGWGRLLDGPGPRPGPLFVSYYECGGFLKGGTGDQWPFQALAAAGIDVLCIQQLPYQEEEGVASGVSAYRTAVDAVRSAVAFLAADGVTDPARLGMGGLSFGSEATMFVAMKTDLLAAISIASATLEPATYFYFNALPGRDFEKRIAAAWGLRPPDESMKEWQALSPALNAKAIDVPLLMQVPEQEFRYNMRLYTQLLRLGRPVDFFVFPNERHLIAQPRHRLAAYERNLDWFRFWLLAEADDDPASAEQFTRWNRLKNRYCADGAKHFVCGQALRRN